MQWVMARIFCGSIMRLTCLILVILHSVTLAQSNHYFTHITLGDTPEKVIRILGQPDKKRYGPTYEVWYYGEEYLQFKHKSLLSYSNAAALLVEVLPKRFRPVDHLNLDSKPDHILSVLGTPSKIDQGYLRDIWFYGHEEIHLKNDTIMYYSDRDALKFKFTAKRLNSDPLYLKSLTINDLITILGTPTRLQRGLEYDTWWYETNFILTRGEGVYFINKKPQSLRNAPPLVISDPNSNQITRKLKLFLEQQLPSVNVGNQKSYRDL